MKKTICTVAAVSMLVAGLAVADEKKKEAAPAAKPAANAAKPAADAAKPTADAAKPASDAAKPTADAAKPAADAAKPAPEAPAKTATKEEAKPAAAPAKPAMAASGDVKIEGSICARVENMEPIEAGDTIAASNGTVSAWTRVHGVTDGVVHHVWFKGDTQYDDITLDVKGSPWRTYSRKTLTEESKGDWRVEVRDGNGAVLETLKFKVD